MRAGAIGPHGHAIGYVQGCPLSDFRHRPRVILRGVNREHAAELVAVEVHRRPPAGRVSMPLVYQTIAALCRHRRRLRVRKLRGRSRVNTVASAYRQRSRPPVSAKARNCQKLWIGGFQATSDPAVWSSGGIGSRVISVGRSSSLPDRKILR